MKLVHALRALVTIVSCASVSTIKVPVSWQDVEDFGTSGQSRESSESKLDSEINEYDDIPQPIKVEAPPPIPADYFLYPNQKPKFAVDLAQFHGVPHPQQYFRATPIQPILSEEPSKLGYRILPAPEYILTPVQRFSKTHEKLRHLLPQPVSANYEVFHPYQQEIPELSQHYKDPILLKIQNDVNENKERLQRYQEEAGKPDVKKEDYLKSPEQIENEKFQESEDPTYVAEKKPTYYKNPKKQKDHINRINSKLQDPLQQNVAKIKPIHYEPLQNYFQQFKEQQAGRFGEGVNDYPQKTKSGQFAEPPEGYDIYEKEKENYENLKAQLTGEHSVESGEEEDAEKSTKRKYSLKKDTKPVKKEFVPVKSYAQVRKTESKKHLPKKAAYEDADSLDEIINAPRLREAVKSTKAQTVYSEEGFEDSAYDHAGQQKHASNQEGHAGYLKEDEKSKGRYKGPEIDESHREAGAEYAGDDISDGKSWNDEDGNSEEHNDEDIEIEDEGNEDEEIDYEKEAYRGPSVEEEIENSEARNEEYISKKYPYSENSEDYTQDEKPEETSSEATITRRKRNVNFQVPSLDLTDSFLTDDEILKLSKEKFPKLMKKNKRKVNRYPYYKSNGIHKHSPLRYAENLALVPKKTKGGTEFYDSRSHIECPEVEDEVDPIPERIKNRDPKDDSEDDKPPDDESAKEPKLNGLGDKIDCFKAKYFGENPLDSPFFKEELVDMPEPIIVPKLKMLDLSLKNKTEPLKSQKLQNNSEGIEGSASNNRAVVLYIQSKNDSASPTPGNQIETNKDFNNKLIGIIDTPQPLNEELSVYSDILKNIRLSLTESNVSDPKIIPLLLTSDDNEEHRVGILPLYKSFKNKKDVINFQIHKRRKRSTDFIYEPYKIIRAPPEPENKRTTTSGKISPLIKTLQSSKFIDSKSPSSAGDAKFKPIIYLSKNSKEVNLDEAQVPIVVISNERRGEPMYEIAQRDTLEMKNQKLIERKPIKFVEYDPKKPVEKLENLPFHDKSTKSQKEHPHLKFDVPYFDVSAYLPKPLMRVRRNDTDESKNNQPERRPAHFRRRSRKGQNVESESRNVDHLVPANKNSEQPTTSITPRHVRINTSLKKNSESTTASPHSRSKPTPLTKLDNHEEKSTVNKNSAKNKQVRTTSRPKVSEKSTKKQETRVFTDTQSYGEPNKNSQKENVDSMIDTKDSMDDYIPEEFKDEEDSQPLKINIQPKQMKQSSEEFEDSPETDESNENVKSSEENSNENSDSSNEKTSGEDQDEIPSTENPNLKQNMNIKTENRAKDDTERVTVKTKHQYKIPDDVELIRQDLRISEGPKHGGNYRQITQQDEENEKQNEGLQVDTRRTITNDPKQRLQQYKVLDRRSRKEKMQSNENDQKSEVIKADEIPIKKTKRRRGKIADSTAEPAMNIAKMTELMEDDDGGHIQMHGGNLQHDEPKFSTTTGKEEDSSESTEKTFSKRRGSSLNTHNSLRAADVLNSLAQAIPVLTTAPPFILDPSKRMYYYVDA